MSRIDKLSILGIRAFDNKKSETIQFQAPLTLIVGSNGSGKTTIIECLKYVTAGESPPNSKGGAFIHDPKLCGEREVMANVKMSFVSAEGVHMVVSRAMQLTVKKASRSVKALEGSVKMKKGGETNTISSRVGEMNQMMPRFLGVSKAVLENVIFCHQDESLWPLMEPAKLKERFDEIFEALKYTKAIENIKILQKAKKAELIQFNADEQHLKVNNEKGKKLEERTQKLQDSSDELREEANEVTKKMRETIERIDHAYDELGRAKMIVGELNGKRIQRATKEENVQSLKENLVEMTDSDEELERMLSQYEDRVKDYEEDLQQQKQRYQGLGEDIQDTRNRLGDKERECGALEAQKQRHEYQTQERKRLVQETARKHDIRGFDLDVDDKQALNFISRITANAKEQNAAFERARQETQDQLKRIQKVIDEINARRSTAVQKKDSARSTINAHDHKIESLQNQINGLSADEGSLEAIRSQLEDSRNRLEKQKSSAEMATLNEQIESLDVDMRRLEDRKEKLDTELVEVTRRAGDSAQLDLVARELKERQRSLETMVSAHGDKISTAVGADWSPANLESGFQRVVDRHASSTAEAERQRDGTIREMEQVDFQLNRCRTGLRAKQDSLQSAAKAIREAVDCEPQDYQEEVQQLESTRDILRADTDSFQMLSNYFEACLKAAKEHKACKTCMRSLKSDKELDILIKTVEKERQKFKDSISESEIQQTEEDLKAARAVSTDFDTWERLRDKEIPSLETEQRQLSEKRERLVAQVEDHDSAVNERKAAKREVDALSRTVHNIVKYQEEIRNLTTQLHELEAKSKATGLSRGLELIQSDAQKATEELRVTKTRISEVSAQRDRLRSSIAALELETRDILAKFSTAEFQLKERNALQLQVEEYKALQTEQREVLKSADLQLQGLVPELSTAQAQYDDVLKCGADRERELAAEATELKTSVNRVSAVDQEVREYTLSGKEEQLRASKREAETLKANIVNLETEQSHIVREVKALEDQLRNHSETKRSIVDNQRYRRDLRQLHAVRKEIAELETHNAEDDKAHWEREGIDWQTERNKLSAQQSSVVAQIKVIDDQISQNLKDWDTDYKDAAQRYREAHVHAETTKAAIEDLGRYAGALDKAIMKYHSLKMEEINRIIEEIWRRTYQGTDVDSILIRSESEAGKSNKSYNYRVCMVKQDVEMDMRGRCSAGQKVLACIIIRLALAECFGVNCGLIALDEPTTNLDAENIRALAESLNEIIRVRRAQRNFQLIVITHDEQFLRYMGCSDFTDVYYRVGRDDEQNSKIERRNIAEVL